MAEKTNRDLQTVVIDEEPYVLMIPSYDMMTRLIAWANRYEVTHPGMDIDCFVYQMWENRDTRAYCAYTYFDLEIGRARRAQDDARCGWRPMLVPLNRKGIFSHCLMGTENGTIVHGGTFWHRFSDSERFQQADFSKKFPGRPILDGVPLSTDFFFFFSCDDPSKNIPWVVWDGRLVCAGVLVDNCSLITLSNRNGCLWPTLTFNYDVGLLEV